MAFATLDLSLYQLPQMRRTEMADMEAAVRDKSPGSFTRLGKSLSVGWYGVLEFCLQLVKLWPLWVVLLLAVVAVSYTHLDVYKRQGVHLHRRRHGRGGNRRALSSHACSKGVRECRGLPCCACCWLFQ